MIEVKELKRTCIACPAQWEGILSDGRIAYIRYRWGYLSVRVSKIGTTDIMDAVSGKEIFGEQLDKNSMDGYMDYETLKRVTKDTLVLPSNEIEDEF